MVSGPGGFELKKTKIKTGGRKFVELRKLLYTKHFLIFPQ